MIAVDTNVLVYAVTEDDPHHAASRSLVEAVAKGLVLACVFPQNLLEFYAVSTNPRQVAQALTCAQAIAEVTNLRSIFRVVIPKESSLDHLPRLIASAGTTGADIFDAFIVAQMRDAGIETLCTYNARDFSSFSVRVTTPEETLDSLGVSPDGLNMVHERPGRGQRYSG